VKYIQMMDDMGFLANVTIATILIGLLSTNQADKTLQKHFQKFV
jgi:hypothetical protein